MSSFVALRCDTPRAKPSTSVCWSATPGPCRPCLSTISFSVREAGDEQPDGAVAGGHDQSAVQNSANADGRLAVRNAGGAGDSGEAEPYRISRSLTAVRDRRAGTQHD